MTTPAALWSHVDRFYETVDPDVVFAGADGDLARAEAGPTDRDLDDAIGWLRWCRFLVTGSRDELAAAVARFAAGSAVPAELAAAWNQLAEPAERALDEDEVAAETLFALSGLYYRGYLETGDVEQLATGIAALP